MAVGMSRLSTLKTCARRVVLVGGLETDELLYDSIFSLKGYDDSDGSSQKVSVAVVALEGKKKPIRAADMIAFGRLMFVWVAVGLERIT